MNDEITLDHRKFHSSANYDHMLMWLTRASFFSRIFSLIPGEGVPHANYYCKSSTRTLNKVTRFINSISSLKYKDSLRDGAIIW